MSTTGFSMKILTFNISMGLLLLLLLLDMSGGQSNQDCCLSYTKKPLPRKGIRGFTEQFSSEVCDIDAVIFDMRNGVKACANPKHKWVKDHVCWLSGKLKKLSKFLLKARANPGQHYAELCYNRFIMH